MYAKHLERIKESEIEHYKPMLFNEKDSKIIVGARNHILIMNQTDFESSMLEDYVSRLDIEKMKNCYQKGVDQEYCNNFITTLLQIPPIINYTKQGQILVCGTYSYSPECQIRQLNDNFDIVAKSTFIHSPHSPYWNTTSLLTKKGEFFFGGPLDYRGVDVTIIKQINILPTQEPEYVRGIQNNHYWINKDANFVASFQYEQHVYFLFRESDMEHSNMGGHRVMSRIGRVCKKDSGLQNHWTTFLKARLNCSLPGSIPFYLNEIQSVHYIHNDKSYRFYAVFNTPQNSLHGSAVCVFTMKSVLRSFEGAFRYQPSPSQLWQRQDDDHTVFNCQASHNDHSQSHLSLKYQLMDDAVQPINDKPLIFTKHEHFKLIAVDWIETKFDNFVQIIFIATNDGKLLKYVHWSNLDESCLIDAIQLINPKENQFLSMKFYRATDSLYFGTEKEFIRLSVDQCDKYPNEEECINSGDPYCGWNRYQMKCIRSSLGILRDENFIQNKNPQSCQQLWSDWFSCSVTDPKTFAQGICQCRQRPCASTTNNNCFKGFEYQVTDCVVYHTWKFLFVSVIVAVLLSSSITALMYFYFFPKIKKRAKKSKPTPKLEIYKKSPTLSLSPAYSMATSTVTSSLSCSTRNLDSIIREIGPKKLTI